MYCPLCPGQVELECIDGPAGDGFYLHAAVCPACGFGLRAPTETQVQDALSTLWCFMPRPSTRELGNPFSRLNGFLHSLEPMSDAERFDAFYLEVHETGGAFDFDDADTSTWTLDLHGYVGLGNSEASAIADWRVNVTSPRPDIVQVTRLPQACLS